MCVVAGSESEEGGEPKFTLLSSISDVFPMSADVDNFADVKDEFLSFINCHWRYSNWLWRKQQIACKLAHKYSQSFTFQRQNCFLNKIYDTAYVRMSETSSVFFGK